ncbi:ABC transporter substrate-binding protein [Kineococcus sp. SYSU DK003]|uniref:ABC transporter substrate-binding protein n=1 Tax=Kineococcus sp. SYSU DK003 TaxID=3383124 RepID=UPI003D7E3FA8
MKRRDFTLLAGGSSLAIALTGCVDAGQDEASGSSTGGSGATPETITVAASAIASSYDWDAGGVYTNENFETNQNTQANLIRNPYVDTGDQGLQTQDYANFEGVLCEEENPYTVSDDGLTYTFNLRQDVLSQAGNPFTADDVMWSFERKYNVPTSPTPGVLSPYFEGLSQIRRVDDFHVSFTVKQPSDGFTLLGVLANLYGRIYDSTVLKANATPDDPYATAWSKVNSGWGYGAYTVESMTPNTELVLVANPNYVFGEPEVKRVVIKQVTDPGTRVSMLQSGDIQFAEQLRPADQALFLDMEGFTAPTFEHPIEFLDLAAVTNKAPFDDVAVRQALVWAVPYSEIVKQVYSGRAVEAQGLINPQTEGYTLDGIEKYSYDPEKAQQILSDAGYTEPVAFTLSVANNVPDAVDTAVLIKSYAESAGFAVTVQQEQSAAFAQGRSGGTFQALLYRTRAQTQSPVYSTASWFLPNNNTGNVPRWEDPEFYRLVDEGRAIADPLSEEAGEKWNEITRYVMSQAPETALVMIQPSMVFTSSLTGYAYRTDSTIDYARITAS